MLKGKSNLTLKKIFYFLTSVLLFYFLFFVYLYFSGAEEYNRYNRNEIQKADALVVFFGDFDDAGMLSAESKRRLNFAVDLYKREIGENIIFVGGYRPSKKVHGSVFMAERAESLGVKPDNIFHDETSRDTIHNWKEAEKIISENGFKRVILVSSLFHILRIEKMVKAGGSIEASCLCYAEDNIYPGKSMLESLSEYNYNIISIIVYLALPERFYQDTINWLRS